MTNFSDYSLNFDLYLPIKNWSMPSMSFSNFNFFNMNTFAFSPFQTVYTSLFNSFMNDYSYIFNNNNYTFAQNSVYDSYQRNYQPFYTNTMFANTNLNTNIKTGNSGNIDTFVKSQSSSNTLKTSNTNKISLSSYNASKGERLARIARKNATDWNNSCATQVKNDIQEAGLGRYVLGDAYKMIDILNNNPNFRQISTENVDLKSLPGGCVLVYGKGVEGYSREFGHTEITYVDKKTGETKAASDGITQNLYKKPTAIFIPV